MIAIKKNIILSILLTCGSYFCIQAAQNLSDIATKSPSDSTDTTPNQFDQYQGSRSLADNAGSVPKNDAASGAGIQNMPVPTIVIEPTEDVAPYTAPGTPTQAPNPVPDITKNGTQIAPITDSNPPQPAAPANLHQDPKINLDDLDFPDMEHEDGSMDLPFDKTSLTTAKLANKGPHGLYVDQNNADEEHSVFGDLSDEDHHTDADLKEVAADHHSVRQSKKLMASNITDDDDKPRAAVPHPHEPTPNHAATLRPFQPASGIKSRFTEVFTSDSEAGGKQSAPHISDIDSNSYSDDDTSRTTTPNPFDDGASQLVSTMTPSLFAEKQPRAHTRRIRGSSRASDSTATPPNPLVNQDDGVTSEINNKITVVVANSDQALLNNRNTDANKTNQHDADIHNDTIPANAEITDPLFNLSDDELRMPINEATIHDQVPGSEALQAEAATDTHSITVKAFGDGRPPRNVTIPTNAKLTDAQLVTLIHNIEQAGASNNTEDQRAPAGTPHESLDTTASVVESSDSEHVESAAGTNTSEMTIPATPPANTEDFPGALENNKAGTNNIRIIIPDDRQDAITATKFSHPVAASTNVTNNEVKNDFSDSGLAYNLQDPITPAPSTPLDTFTPDAQAVPQTPPMFYELSEEDTIVGAPAINKNQTDGPINTQIDEQASDQQNHDILPAPAKSTKRVKNGSKAHRPSEHKIDEPANHNNKETKTPTAQSSTPRAEKKRSRKKRPSYVDDQPKNNPQQNLNEQSNPPSNDTTKEHPDDQPDLSESFLDKATVHLKNMNSVPWSATAAIIASICADRIVKKLPITESLKCRLKRAAHGALLTSVLYNIEKSLRSIQPQYRSNGWLIAASYFGIDLLFEYGCDGLDRLRGKKTSLENNEDDNQKKQISTKEERAYRRKLLLTSLMKKICVLGAWELYDNRVL